MSVDRAWLEQVIAEDEHGLLEVPVKAPPKTAEARLVDAFKEVCAFIERHGRAPEENPNDITEWQLHHRLKGIVNDPDQREALKEYDVHGVLVEPEPPASIEEIIASDDFGVLDGDDEIDIFTLKHVPETREEPEEVAERRPCKDFADFEPLFKECHAQLRTGERTLILPERKEATVNTGTFFVVRGVLAYVASVGEESREKSGRRARLRVIFENGTESNLLLRSLTRHLYDGGRVVTEPAEVTLEKLGFEVEAGHGEVYVLRSLSTDPQVVEIPNLHKIGFTKGSTKKRIVQASEQRTYLNAPVEIVATWAVDKRVASDIESLLHRFFDAARIEVTYERDGERVASAREWFSVPIEAIDEAVQLIAAGTIANYRYDAEERQVVLRM